MNERGEMQCKLCGEFKAHTEYTAAAGRWMYNCRTCESDRIAYHGMVRRIEKHGIATEIAAYQRAERELKARKARLERYITTLREKGE